VAAGVLSLMSIVKLTTAATVVVLAAGFTWLQTDAARVAHARLASAREELVALRARRDALAVPAGRPPPTTRLVAPAAARPLPARPVPPEEESEEQEERERATGRAFVAAHPEFGRLVRQDRQRDLAGSYLPLYRTLGLDARQIAEFEVLMLNEDSMSYPDYKLRVSFRTMSDEEQDARLRALLGDEGYRRLQDYRRTWVGTYGATMANQLGGALYFTAAPLQPDQGERLVRAFHRQSLPHDWDAIFAEAESYLSARQLEALRGLRAQSESGQAAGAWFQAFDALKRKARP